jgi:hypothetical protein
MRTRLDDWCQEQTDVPSRSEAIRRLIELGLAGSATGRRRSPKARAKAAELAAQVIDRKLDPTAPPEEQASRKRRLLKGPKEFRELRRNHPTPKRS